MYFQEFGIIGIALAFVVAATPFAVADKDDVDYPEGFRTFTHVTTGIVTPGFIFNGVDLGAIVPGLHNIYANKKAMNGAITNSLRGVRARFLRTVQSLPSTSGSLARWSPAQAALPSSKRASPWQ